MGTNVSLVTDYAHAQSVSFHDALIMDKPPPAPPRPQPNMLHIEAPVPMNWSAGSAKHSYSSTVSHKGLHIVLEGHDCGKWIPHINIPPMPPNLILPITMMNSSRKMMFSASTVKMDGTSTACSELVGLPPVPMLICSKPVAIPFAFNVLNMMHTVQVGMNIGDVLFAIISYGLSALVDKLFSSGDPPGALPTDYLKTPKDYLKDSLKSIIVGLATGLISMGLRGEGNLGFSLGTPDVKLTISFSRSRDGTWTKSATGIFHRHQVKFENKEGKKTWSYKYKGPGYEPSFKDGKIKVVDHTGYADKWKSL
jgi:hypothetical protein